MPINVFFGFLNLLSLWCKRQIDFVHYVNCFASVKSYYKCIWYWLNYRHILVSKGTSGFTSNTLLIRIQYCYQSSSV